ncbi:MAG: addiction module protein [Armatimonadetes bacterium]|nr:addiction module protein [Armatimonadota bacterium]
MPVTDIPEIARLTTHERILLVEALWESITPEAEALSVPQSHKDELDRRLRRHQANPGKLLSLEDLQERIEARK